MTAEITQLEEDLSKARPNLTVLNEYRKREAEYLERARDMESVTEQRDSAKKRYDDLRKVRLDEFMAGFSAISAKLKEMYQVSTFSFSSCTDLRADCFQMITQGGNAEIELIDSMDPFSEGESSRSPEGIQIAYIQVSSYQSCLPKRVGELSQTCRAVKRRSPLSHWSLHYTSSSLPLCTLWQVEVLCLTPSDRS